MLLAKRGYSEMYIPGCSFHFAFYSLLNIYIRGLVQPARYDRIVHDHRGKRGKEDDQSDSRPPTFFKIKT